MTQNSSNLSVAEPDLVDSTNTARGENISDRVLFLRKFLNKGLAISSAVPSSRFLVDEVLRHVDFSHPANIVELGAGTGAITETILDQLRPHHRFAMIEIDSDFCQILRRRFPDTTLIQADASNISEPLARIGIHKADYILSGLPSPNLPLRSMVGLWHCLKELLTPNGLFIQITNAPLVYRKFYERLFGSVEYHMVWLNIPPGGVYRCANLRASLRRGD